MGADFLEKAQLECEAGQRSVEGLPVVQEQTIRVPFSLGLSLFKGGAFIIGCLVFVTFVILKAVMFIPENPPH